MDINYSICIQSVALDADTLLQLVHSIKLMYVLWTIIYRTQECTKSNDFDGITINASLGVGRRSLICGASTERSSVELINWLGVCTLSRDTAALRSALRRL